MNTASLVALAAACFAGPTLAQGTVPVTVENFIRAETDRYFSATVEQAGGTGKFHHRHELMRVDQQTVVRPNRDTLYSTAVIDLDAGPVTVTLPDPGGRFMSLQAINEDGYVVGQVAYGAGAQTIDRAQVGTRYVLLGFRLLVDPNDQRDMQQAFALQDKVVLRQAALGRFETPQWDEPSRARVRRALFTLATTLPDFNHAFGAPGEVDPVRRLVGNAAAWGGNREKDAVYLNVNPAKNDGTTVHRFTVKDVPIDEFWSVSVYNAEGQYEPNALNAYSLNNVTARKNPDGGVTVQFGGCDGQVPNCLPIVAGWNYTVRLYRPRAAILDGSWTFPEATPVG